MTVHLMQLDSEGQESITSLFQSPEEAAFFEWLGGLEAACPGVVIFVHRLTDAGHDLCTVPAAHSELVARGSCPPRYCGCLTCGIQREAIRDLTAWNITEIAEKLAHEYLSKLRAMQGARGEHGLEEQL